MTFSTGQDYGRKPLTDSSPNVTQGYPEPHPSLYSPSKQKPPVYKHISNGGYIGQPAKQSVPTQTGESSKPNTPRYVAQDPFNSIGCQTSPLPYIHGDHHGDSRHRVKEEVSPRKRTIRSPSPNEVVKHAQRSSDEGYNRSERPPQEGYTTTQPHHTHSPHTHSDANHTTSLIDDEQRYEVAQGSPRSISNEAPNVSHNHSTSPPSPEGLPRQPKRAASPPRWQEEHREDELYRGYRAPQDTYTRPGVNNTQRREEPHHIEQTNTPRQDEYNHKNTPRRDDVTNHTNHTNTPRRDEVNNHTNQANTSRRDEVHNHTDEPHTDRSQGKPTHRDSTDSEKTDQEQQNHR